MSQSISIDITPVSVVTTVTVDGVEESKVTKSIDRIEINKDIRIFLNTSAQVTVLRFSGTTLYDIQHLTMTGTDYDNYGTDDTYVNTWVLAQLGYTVAV